MSGMQAMAAATFEGKPVEVDVGLLVQVPDSTEVVVEFGSSWIGHGLHTQTWKCFVKQSSAPLHFRFHLESDTTIVALFPPKPMTRNLSRAFTMI